MSNQNSESTEINTTKTLDYPPTGNLKKVLEFLKENGVIDSYECIVEGLPIEDQECFVFTYCIEKDGKTCVIGETDAYAEAIVTLEIEKTDNYEDGLNAVVCQFDKLDKAIKSVLSLIK